MVTGRTADLEIVVGGASRLVQLAHVLGASITGGANVTTEPVLGREIEAASVHSVSQEPSFSTVYDTAQLDGGITGLLGDAHLSTPANDFWWVCWSTRAPVTWQAIAVDLSKPGLAAPAADAISRPWSFSDRARGAFGFMVVPFTIDVSSATTESLLTKSDDRSALGLEVVMVVTTNLTSGATAYQIIDGTADPIGLEESNGVQGPFELSATDQTLTIGASTQDVTGVALLGKRELLPSG